MIAAPISSEQRFHISLIPWETYVLYSDGLGPRHIRVTYDRGEMELMTLSFGHENKKSRCKDLLSVLFQDMKIDAVCGGSVTCRREEMLRGLEPDDSYWITHAMDVLDLENIDLAKDPPPDLALEVEISRSVLNRMSIYAALQIPEVWRLKGENLSVHLLTARGSYRVSKRSKALPFLPIEKFSAFLNRTGISDPRLAREFRVWIRENRAAWKK